MSAGTSSHAPPLLQSRLDALLGALWTVLCPGCNRPQSFELGSIFSQLSQSISGATDILYTNYFDPVITHPPAGRRSGNRQDYNLGLSCFNSWADLKKEQDRARDRSGQLFFPTVHHYSGLRLSRLVQYRSRGATSSQSSSSPTATEE